MYRLAIIILLATTIAYGLACLALFCGQRRLLYLPPAPGRLATTYATESLQLADVAIHMTVKTATSDKALLYFGGNAEWVAQHLSSLAAAFPGFAVYLPDYRGYGGTNGQPSEPALQQDALAVFDYVHAKHSQVAVIGRSLGTGVATYLASVRPVARLVLVTPYDSIEAIAKQQYPLFPVSWLLQDKFESWRYVPKITTPTTIITAQQDQIIPAENSKRLYNHFKTGVARYVELPAVNHDTVVEGAMYLTTLREAIHIDLLPLPATK
jgi:uncharacterized protein